MQNMKESERNLKIIVWGISAVVMITAAILDHFFGEEVFAYSIEFSSQIQKYDLYIPSVIFSQHVMGVLTLYPFATFFFRREKQKPLLNIFGLGFFLFLMSSLKLIYMDSRPSFKSETLSEAHHYCEPDYGKPSGHAFLSMGLSLFIIRDLFPRIANKFLRVAVVGLMLLVPVCVSFSRAYFGVHSLNQLTLGLLLGVFSFMTLLVMEEAIYDIYFKPVLDRKSNNLSVKIFLVFLCIAWSATFGFLFALYLRAWSRQQQDISSHESSWRFFSSIVRCKYVTSDIERGFASKIMAEGILSHFVLSFLLGCYLCPINPAIGFQLAHDKSVIKTTLRVIVLLIPLSILVFSKYPPPLEAESFIFKHFWASNISGLLTGLTALPMMKLLSLNVKESEEREDPQKYELKIKLDE